MGLNGVSGGYSSYYDVAGWSRGDWKSACRSEYYNDEARVEGRKMEDEYIAEREQYLSDFTEWLRDAFNNGFGVKLGEVSMRDGAAVTSEEERRNSAKFSAEYLENNPAPSAKPALTQTNNYRFFTIKNMFTSSVSNINPQETYTVDGVEFSGEEMEIFKKIFLAAQSIMPSGRGYLDYDDYANIGIGIALAKNYAGKYFNDEQAAMVEKVVRYYKDELLYKNEKMQTLAGLTTDGSCFYYAKRERNGARCLSVASNKGTAEYIMEKYANINFDDENSWNNADAAYRERMQSAYSEQDWIEGRTSSSNERNKRINEDLAGIHNNIKSAQSFLKNMGAGSIDVYA